MPALSIATSVPVPIAMPTSACASAGASLMPSPAIATMRPCCCSRAIASRFWSGSTSAMTSSIGELRRDGLGRPALSPVSITIRRPSPLELAQRLRRRCLDRIGDAEQAGRAPVDRDEHDRLALAGEARRRCRRAAAASTPCFGDQRRVAEQDLAALDDAGDAAPGPRLECRTRPASQCPGRARP